MMGDKRIRGIARESGRGDKGEWGGKKGVKDMCNKLSRVTDDW